MIDPNDRNDVKRALEEDCYDELYFLPISAAHNCPDRTWCENICLLLSSHDNDTIRGNAILSFGHIARIFGVLDNRVQIREIIVGALHSESEYVRGQAECAAMDVQDFLGWNLKRERRKARKGLRIRW